MSPGELRRLLLASLAFATFAPVGLVAVPLAGLLLLSPPVTRAERLGLMFVVALGLWWLARTGSVADQVLRAAAVLGGTTFALLTRYTRASVAHRGLLAVTVAAVGVALSLLAAGWSWDAVRWWVERDTSFNLRMLLAVAWPPPAGADSGGTLAGVPTELGRWLESGVRVMADHYAALAALQLLAGLALATALYQRVSHAPVGAPPGRFRDFRFSEHLGWAAAASLIVILIPRLAAAKLAALNLLAVAGVLYALRGAAVTVFGLGLLGGPGIGTIALMVLATLFILPAVVGGAIVLGVVDASFDLRRRWAAAAANR